MVKRRRPKHALSISTRGGSGIVSVDDDRGCVLERKG
jgi:hypothetical protein